MSRLVRRWGLIALSAFLCLTIFYQLHGHQLQLFRSISSSKEKQLGPIRWHSRQELFPLNSFRPLPSSIARTLPAIQTTFPIEDSGQKVKRLRRQQAVKDAFVKSWKAYKKHAWGQDEVMPISGGSKETFGGRGATLVDSLDSLWILGLEQEFADAVAVVQHIDFSRASRGMLNVFETTIRYLGGLLSAYDLSDGRYPVLLQKATELGHMLYAAFDTPNRMPMCRWYWENTAQNYAAEAASLTLSAEIGSLTLEFTRLSQLTGDPKYYDAVQRISDELARQQDLTFLPGLWPVTFDAAKLNFTHDRTFTLGGMADSLYEYLPKEYLMLGGNGKEYQTMYEKFAAAAAKHILFRPMIPDNDRELLIAGTTRKTLFGDGGFKFDPEGQHLTCFLGGVFGIASRIFQRPDDLEIAEKLVDGCVWAYEASPNGIAPEIWRTWPCPNAKSCEWDEQQYFKGVIAHGPSMDSSIKPKSPEEHAKKYIQRGGLAPGFTDIRDTRYILRPEAIESVFVLYRITGDLKYQDIAWNMFTAIKKATETDLSFAALSNVIVDPPTKIDSQESFWMAETLKYFYLIFSEPELVSLDDYVLNTEAHPLRRPQP